MSDDWKYRLPKGKCDMCGVKKASYWFGDTSVALCDDKQCSEDNMRNWEALLQREKDELKGFYD